MAKTVILIDDDQDDLDILKETLTSLDPALLCTSFIYPVEAVRVLTSDLIAVPDYIITDINMPRMTGDQCVKEFRRHKEFSRTIITVLSTTMQADFAARLKNMGANFTFQKPNSFQGYKELLRPVFERDHVLSNN